MPNIKSSIKRAKSSIRKADVNKMQKSKLRTLLKKTEKAVAASAAEAGDLVVAAQSALDKAARKGIISKNRAARKKSRLVKALAAGK